MRILGTALLIVFGLAVPALEARAGGWDSPACKADFERLCPGVEPGEGRLFQCISQHLDELSPQCRAAAHEGHRDLHGGDARPVGGSCRDDAMKLCAEVPHGSGGLFGCLQQKYQLLSPDCQVLVQAMGMRIQKVQADCKDEIAKYCAAGTEAVTKCLGDRLSDLSEGCRASLTSGFGRPRPSGTMPAGHPSVGMPAGHPSVATPPAATPERTE